MELNTTQDHILRQWADKVVTKHSLQEHKNAFLTRNSFVIGVGMMFALALSLAITLSRPTASTIVVATLIVSVTFITFAICWITIRQAADRLTYDQVALELSSRIIQDLEQHEATPETSVVITSFIERLGRWCNNQGDYPLTEDELRSYLITTGRDGQQYPALNISHLRLFRDACLYHGVTKQDILPIVWQGW